MDNKTSQIVEAGACLWEAIIDETVSPDALQRVRKYRKSQGTSSLRMMVIGQAENCHDEWWTLCEEDRMDEPFDWEFCPSWLTKWIMEGGLDAC